MKIHLKRIKANDKFHGKNAGFVDSGFVKTSDELFIVVTENIDDLQNEVDACGKTPPSTPVVEEMVTKKAAAAAFIGQKLNQNVHFQKFNQNKGKFQIS